LSSVLKYAYINAMVRGMKTRLLDKERFYTLIGSRDLKGLLHLLEDTPYRSDVHRIMEDISPITVEQVLMENFIRTVENIIEISPRDLKEILKKLLQRFEVSNLKLVLRAKHSGLGFPDIQSKLLPLKRFGKEMCRLLLERTNTIDDVVDLLKPSPYGEALRQSLVEYRLRGTLLPLETALDKLVYQTLLNSAYKLGGLDGKIAREIFGSEVDTVNIKTAIRCKLLGVELDIYQNYILPRGFVFDEEYLVKAYTSPGIEKLFEAFLVHPYKSYIQRGFEDYRKTGSLMRLEVELEKALANVNREICHKYPSPLHIGVVLSYLNLKWFEVKNLRTIMLGKLSKIPSEKIAKLLIY